MRRHVAIIGGGVSGLAAAHQFRKLRPDDQITLFESGPRLGGVIQTVKKDGFLIEGAADNFITTMPAALELCRDLGLGDDLIRTNPNGRGADVLTRGRLEPIPSGFMVMAPSRIWPLLSTRILSPWGKIRSGLELFVPRKRSGQDESLSSFVCRRFGKEMFERLVQPLVGGIYTADPDRLSVAATMPRFLEMEKEHGSLIRGMLASRRKKRDTKSSDRGQALKPENSGGARYSQFMTLRGGMSQLIDALAKQLPEQSVRLATPVEHISQDDAGWRLRTERQPFASESFDGIIMCAPAGRASHLLENIDESIAAELSQIPYASCGVVSLAFRRDQIGHPLGSFGFVVPQIEQHFILSCSFSSLKYEGRAPEEMVLMRVFIGGACQPGLLRLPDAQLVELAQWELAKILDIDGEPVMQHVNRQSSAMPQYHVGHKQRITRVKQRLAEYPTLALAGNALSGVGVPGCIESGQKAALRIAESFNEGSKQSRMGAFAEVC